MPAIEIYGHNMRYSSRVEREEQGAESDGRRECSAQYLSRRGCLYTGAGTPVLPFAGVEL